MIKIILWDVDGTLLDFSAAEKNALAAVFKKYNLGSCSDEMIARYARINQKYWRRLERGEISKAEVLEGRFREFFAAEQIDFTDIRALNNDYQLFLGDTICFIDDAYNLIASLQGKVKQYAVTNGTFHAQKKKLDKSGLIQLFDAVFISDLIGAEKPTADFFEYVFRHIEECKKEDILIVGDSLTGDIQGGINAAVKTCWYNPKNLEKPKNMEIDYIITNLHQVKDIISTS